MTITTLTRRGARRRWISALASTALLAGGLALAGCSTDSGTSGDAAAGVSSPSAAQPTTTPDDILASHGLAGQDAPAVIDALDALPVSERPDDLMASVRPGALMLSDDQGREASLPLPEDRFYLSIAPYIDQMHECHFHSLTTCHGELGDTDVHVRVTDDATGEVLVDDTVRTFDNGFAGLWLPRGVEAATLVVEADGRTATAPVSTAGEEDATCLTALQLT